MNRIIIISLLLVAFNLNAQLSLPLYPSAIPNSKSSQIKEMVIEKDGGLYGYRNISEPTLAVFLPVMKTTATNAIIICPGGGYAMESYRLEGIKIAEEFVRNGIAAIILKYRLPSDSIMTDKAIGPLQDAQQAIKIVRQHATEWNLNPKKIGIMGFSAGGHLASTAGTHFEKSYIPNKENTSLRPDFMILVYPVISMKDGLTHKGSRTNLLGESPDEDQILDFSNELHVHSNTPPTWLTHTGDDKAVTVENSIHFYQALIQNGVQAEMHLYPTGDHGFVLSLPTGKWMKPLIEWMSKLE